MLEIFQEISSPKFWALNVVFGLILSIIANMLTPLIQSKLASSFSLAFVKSFGSFVFWTFAGLACISLVIGEIDKEMFGRKLATEYPMFYMFNQVTLLIGFVGILASSGSKPVKVRSDWLVRVGAWTLACLYVALFYWKHLR